MNQLLRDLLLLDYRMHNLTQVRREYGARTVAATVRAGYTEIVKDTLYLTPKGVDRIWKA